LYGFLKLFLNKHLSYGWRYLIGLQQEKGL